MRVMAKVLTGPGIQKTQTKQTIQSASHPLIPGSWSGIQVHDQTDSQQLINLKDANQYKG